jgi:hypothetical protein
MAASKLSPKSTLRKSLREIYRGRGHGNNNIWVVYSVKTDSDWYLPSDRQLVHWLYFLEANPDIRDFDLAPKPILSHDRDGPRATELDAIAIRRDDRVEWHEVKAGKHKHDPTHESQLVAQLSAATSSHAIYKRFNDTDLERIAKTALRWHKATKFAEAIRGAEHIPCRNALVIAMRDLKHGQIQQLLDRLDAHDAAVVLGLIVRLAIRDNAITLDLDKCTFGLQTNWVYRA